MSNALAVIDGNEATPEEILGKQAKIIKALRTVIQKKTVIFRDKDGKESKHIEAMAWQSIASMFGLLPRIIKCEENEHGMLAVCQLVKWSTQAVVGEMDAYVGRDEKQWYGGKNKYGNDIPKKPFNQIRSMSHTRAIRQACKVALGHVVILLESELGIDVNRDAEDLIEDQEALPPPPTKLQWDEIASKKKLAGLTGDDLVKRFGPAEKLTQETAAQVIAHLDGVIASKEGAING